MNEKVVKAVCEILFSFGFIIMAGAIGADDVAVQMHQAQNLHITQMILGMILCVPMIVVHGVK